MKSCALIPAFNEAERVADVARRTRDYVDAVLVVDDGSADATAAVAAAAGAETLRLEPNRGKGAALRAGLDWIVDHDYEYAVCLDADGQHLPEEIPAFLAAAGAGADLVIGNRMGNPKDMPWARWQTNRFTSWLLSRLSRGVRVPDTQCGFRLVRAACWKGVEVRGENYEFEGEMIVAAARAGFSVANVPVTSVYGTEVSRIRPVRDTVRFFRMVWRLWRHPPPAADSGV